MFRWKINVQKKIELISAVIFEKPKMCFSRLSQQVELSEIITWNIFEKINLLKPIRIK